MANANNQRLLDEELADIFNDQSLRAFREENLEPQQRELRLERVVDCLRRGITWKATFQTCSSVMVSKTRN